MQIESGFDWTTLVYIILGVMTVAAILATILTVWVLTQVRRVKLPPNATFNEALLATPLPVVILLDLLDVALDFLSAPVGWLILTRLGLGPLRGVTVVEGLLPGTQLIPTMTLAWILARTGLLGNARLPKK